MTPEAPWTVRRLLEWTTADFRDRRLDAPRLSAELLLCAVLGVDRIRLVTDPERPLRDAELQRFRELVRRRRAGEPVAYLLGHREFYGMELLVDGRVLIPRPDTETLVEVGLRRTRSREAFGRALDLCTGSGCVAIAFARSRPTWRVVGTDLSADALAVARENAVRQGAVFNCCFRQGDLTACLPAEARYELILSNPPYIPTAELETLDVGIRDFEPRLALDGGPDGLDIVRRLVGEAVPRLVPGGVLALEIACDQGERTAELLRAAGLQDVAIDKDYGGNDRVVSAELRR